MIWQVKNLDHYEKKSNIFQLIIVIIVVYVGFAVNLSHLEKFPNATMPFRAGYEEDSFLRSIGLRLQDIEPKANDCTEIYVWHTQTTKKKTPLLKISEEALDRTNSNLLTLLNSLGLMGVSRYSESGSELY